MCSAGCVLDALLVVFLLLLFCVCVCVCVCVCLCGYLGGCTRISSFASPFSDFGLIFLYSYDDYLN